MAVHQIAVKPEELHILLLANLNAAISFAQGWDLDAMANALKRAGEMHLALKEAIAALPKPTSQSTGNAIGTRN